MSHQEISHDVIKCQKGRGGLDVLIRKFEPVLRKYAYLANCEDAYSILVLKLIEVICRINLNTLKNDSDGILISYICKTLHNECINIRRRNEMYKNHTVLFSELDSETDNNIMAYIPIYDDYSAVEFKFLESVLTEYEIQVLKLIYLYGYTSSDIAKARRISRQAVNQTKRNAIKKLQPHLKTNY